MIAKIIFSLLRILLLVAGVGIIAYFSMEETTDEWGNVSRKLKITKGNVIALFVIILLVVSVGALIEVVPNGHRGIKYNINGGVEDTVLSQGWHIVKPTLKVTDFPIYLQNVALTSDERMGSEGDDSFYVPSKDGKQVRVGVEMNYRFDEERLPEMWEKFGGKNPRQIENYHIKGKIKAWTAEATSEYPIIDLYGEKRTDASLKVLKILQDRFEKDGIIVESFNFTSLTPDENSLSAIQDRVDAQQRLETAKIEQKQKQVEADTKVMEAKANAERREIEAQAEKKVNELMQQSVDDKILKRELIKKWDGKLPVVNGGANTIIDFEDLIK